jgi:hypothetical protein
MEFGDAEGEVPVPCPVAGEAHLDQARPFQPVRHFQAAAMPFDAIVFRAFWRVMGMLAKPDDVYTDPDVVARTQYVLSSFDTAPSMTPPTRAQLEAALA